MIKGLDAYRILCQALIDQMGGVELQGDEVLTDPVADGEFVLGPVPEELYKVMVIARRLEMEAKDINSKGEERLEAIDSISERKQAKRAYEIEVQEKLGIATSAKQIADNYLNLLFVETALDFYEQNGNSRVATDFRQGMIAVVMKEGCDCEICQMASGGIISGGGLGMLLRALTGRRGR